MQGKRVTKIKAGKFSVTWGGTGKPMEFQMSHSPCWGLKEPL